MKQQNQSPSHISSEKEIWKKVDGTKRYYEVSNLGRVRSKFKVLSPSYHPQGYLHLNLVYPDKVKKVLVHKLVLENFSQKTKVNDQVNHKNGIKDDNRLVNLEWATPNENMKHAFEVLGKSHLGIKNPRAKINENAVREIRSYKSYRDAQVLCSKKYNISFGHVKNIYYRMIWKHVD